MSKSKKQHAGAVVSPAPISVQTDGASPKAPSNKSPDDASQSAQQSDIPSKQGQIITLSKEEKKAKFSEIRHSTKGIKSKEQLIKEIFHGDTECAVSKVGTDSGPGESCLDDTSKAKVESILASVKASSSDGGECAVDNEVDKIACLLRKKLTPEQKKDLIAILKENFKALGPGGKNSEDNCNWLSNQNIDKTLADYEKKHRQMRGTREYVHVTFQSRDYKTRIQESGYDISTDPPILSKAEFQTAVFDNLHLDYKNMYELGMRCMSVVFNTDYSTGGGKHWFCIFLDFRKEDQKGIYSMIEYFNSSGEAPLSEVKEYLCSTKQKLLKYGMFGNKTVHAEISENKRTYQEDTHSCGVYSLFYIICRLEGMGVLETMNFLNDDIMHELRRHIFISDKIVKK